MNNPNVIDNISTGHGARNKGGRPVGSTVASVQAKRIARAEAKLIGEQIAAHGTKAALDRFSEVELFRVPLRTDAPTRTITEAKEAALKLINSMLWTLEQNAILRGVCEEDEARVLKLLAGLNAALPKQAETPIKSPADMTEDELRKAAGR
jgi:hypothetical protein